ncbi:unnamed protein product [Allacma fusca]|uniref:Succinate dehydrogenase cytochrome b560 subunit, mitochondrial n=1 Tax=Allacma fusca TaxID=39272 RepID=A0A8J2NW40_9HEXA|nr:unnamed protein product [Allacma fusca]
MSGLIGRMLSRRGAWTVSQYRFPAVNSSKWLTTAAAAKSAPTQVEDYFEKNKRLNRPMSPHLTIYKFQITSMLSITHRGTGLALSALTSGFAIGMLSVPGSFPHYLAILQASQLGSASIFAAKLILAFPLIFHFTNGIRHLAWDMGIGFKNKEVSTTGWTVLGLSLLLAIGAAAM